MYAFNLPSGSYTIAVYPVSCYGTTPVGIYGPSWGYPVGVASLGPVSADRVLGFFNITAIGAYNPIGESQFDVPNSGAALQLNVHLVVNLADGSTQYYWLQDVMDFVTDGNKFDVVDNVWNESSSTSILSNATIAGSGAVYVSADIATQEDWYGYATQEYPYSLPIAGYLLIKLVGINPLTVQFCYAIVQQGDEYYPPNFNCYDTVTIEPYVPAISAFMEAMPNMVTERGKLIDAELVFGGYANGEHTTFDQLEADLSLLYWDGSKWAPFPNLYGIGVSTAETATDLTGTVTPSGFVYVGVGQLPQGDVFLTQYVAKPPLPMTYVQYLNAATFERKGFYIYSPYTYTAQPVIETGRGVEYVFVGLTVNGQPAGGLSVTIQPSGDFATYDVQANYEAYYLVTVSSPIPVTVSTHNETATTTAFAGWVPSGTSVSISIPRYYYFDNNTMLQYLGANKTIVVNGPVDISMSADLFARYYLVDISSMYPVSVNGTSTTEATYWVRGGEVLTIGPETIFTDGVFLTEPGYEVAVDRPTSLIVVWRVNWALTGAMYGAIALVIATAIMTLASRRRRRALFVAVSR
ncbi:MAG: thermopsin family protease [Thermoproteus sp.]